MLRLAGSCEKCNINSRYVAKNLQGFLFMSVKEKLKKIRNKVKKPDGKSRYNQEQFAENMGIPARTYWGYEKGEQDVSVLCLQQLHAVYRVNLNWLLDNKNDNDAEMFILSQKEKDALWQKIQQERNALL